MRYRRNWVRLANSQVQWVAWVPELPSGNWVLPKIDRHSGMEVSLFLELAEDLALFGRNHFTVNTPAFYLL